jgi:hypothetical protein
MLVRSVVVAGEGGWVKVVPDVSSVHTTVTTMTATYLLGVVVLPPCPCDHGTPPGGNPVQFY